MFMGDVMAYLALYRKYRPKSFLEMVGQDKVIRVIKNAVINDKVSHAYLFSGPRGTGKTTTAKIIAKMVNCDNLVDGEPCGKCYSCLNILDSSDVIEIDAASNNGVDEIRELRDKVNLVPSECKYKIYIIDEVHMLTTQAFNALLKTLEEPPKHVIFILATTEFYKIPMTIISRCQKFQFTKISDDDMVSNLRRIVDCENITVDNEILYEISRLSDGCCRDAVNLLDQLISYSNGNIKIEHLYEISGAVSYVELYDILSIIYEKKSLELMEYCNKINNEGKNIFKFVEEFILFLKDIISFKVGINDIKISDKELKVKDIADKFSDKSLFKMIDLLNELLNKIKLSSYPSILLSITLLDFINNDSDMLSGKVESNISLDLKQERLSVSNSAYKNDEHIRKNFNVIVEEGKGIELSKDDIDIRINNSFAVASKELLSIVKEKLDNIDDYLLEGDFSVLSGILRDCLPIVCGSGYLMFVANYDSLVDRFNSSYVDIEKFLLQILGEKYFVVAISMDRWKNEKNKYISNLKMGIKYSLKEYNFKVHNNFDFSCEKKNENDLDLLKDLVGNDIIEYV